MQVSAEYPPDPGGVGDYTRLLSRALIERGHTVVVATSERAGVERTEEVFEDPPRISVAGDWSWRSIGPLLRTIAVTRPEVVHIQYQTGAYHMRLAINLLPFVLRRRSGRPRIVVTAHDLRLPYLLPKAGSLRRFVTHRLLQGADAVIVTNAADYRRLAGHGHADPNLFLADQPIPATIIPIGANVLPRPPEGYSREAWRRNAGICDGEIVVAFFGLASPSKGLRELVKALAATPAFIQLLVVGGEAQSGRDRTYAAEVYADVGRLGLDDRVRFTGYCDPPAVSAHLLAADIGALPFLDGASYRRGSLLALLAHGLPVITTRPEAPLEPPLEDGEQALLVAPGAIAELSAAIERLASGPPLRARLGANGRALLQHFTWPSIAAAHEAVYNGLLGRVMSDHITR